MTDKLQVINPSEFGLEQAKATELTSGLQVSIDERKLLIDEFNTVKDLEITAENIPTFKELRLKFVKNRTQGIVKWHKTNKDFFLTGGRFVDAIKNKEMQINESMEDVLLKAEKHFENLEIERLQKLQETRVKLVSPYIQDAGERDLSSMEEDVFNAFLSTKKKAFEDKAEAKKKATEERIAKEKAEAAERERIAKENEQLRKQAEERERLSKIEEQKRVKAEDERKAKEEAEREEREKQEREKQAAHEAEMKAEREKAEKIEAKARVEKEELEAKIKAKEEAEREERESEAARVQAELNKGDAAKVKDLISDLNALKTKYSFKSAKNQKKLSDVCGLIDKVTLFIEK